MKKDLLLLFCFLLAGFQTFAQTDGGDSDRESKGIGPYIGLTGAVNNTWVIINNELRDNEHYKYKTTFGPAAGLVVGYKFNERHSVQLEGFYSRQGNNFDLTDDSNQIIIGSKDIDLHYFAVPLLFKMSGVGRTRFNIHFGPQVAFLLKGREENTFNQTLPNAGFFNEGTPLIVEKGTYILASTDDAERNKNGAGGKFNKIDPSILLGFGVEQDLSDQLYLSLNLRLNYGFTNIRDEDFNEDRYDADRYTLRYNALGGLQLGLHYFFQKQ